jgi:hypothetical protein
MNAYRLVIPLFFWLQINSALAMETPLNGVWQGQVGQSDIVVCFNGDQSGSYYHSRHRMPIQLSADEKDNSWREQNSTGVWKLDSPINGKLRGVWRDPGNVKTQIISLVSPTHQADAQPCASDSYNKALEAFPELKVGQIEAYQGKQYRTLKIADVETIELLAQDAASQKVNLKLRAILPKTNADLVDFFATRRQFLGDMGLAAEGESFAEPYYWSSDWLTVHFYRWPPGYGAQGITLSYRTWNLRTGDEVDVWEWFGTKSYGYIDMAPLPPKLKAHLLKTVIVEPDCDDNYFGQGDFHATLEPGGIKFWENAFGSGCEKEFTIPYKKLGPFLSEKGRAAIKTLKKM